MLEVSEFATYIDDVSRTAPKAATHRLELSGSIRKAVDFVATGFSSEPSARFDVVWSRRCSPLALFAIHPTRWLRPVPP